MSRSFSSEELCKFLEAHKFKISKQNATSHIKYSHPHPEILPKGIRPFIIVIMKRKEYDPHTSASYRTELRRLGFTNEEIKEKLN